MSSDEAEKGREGEDTGEGDSESSLETSKEDSKEDHHDSHSSRNLLPPRPAGPWVPSWWLPQLNKGHRQKSCQRIAESSAPKSSYFVLIILSTLIASYGLLSNSTATVIGAMIVAPLMGPILGLALGLVLGDIRMFRRSLVAEVSGVVLVVLTGIFVAHAVGIEQIDFQGSEIAGRTRPTLYDLAIGLAAGLAGAYCTVHPGLQASVAGVAIAVALVPPLAVTGLTTAGWLRGVLDWHPAFGSFMLFFANFLTIELAGASIFLATGFRHVKEGAPKADFRRTVAVKLLLLLLTGVFLSGQLHTLLRERYGLAKSRQVLLSLLHDIPGADLDSIEAELKGNRFTVRAVVGSRTDIRPEIVARFQGELEKVMGERLPDLETRLIIRTVSSTYAAADGYLFEPRTNKLDDEQLRHQKLEVELRRVVSRFPGVEMDSFRLLLNEAESNPDRPGKLVPLEVTLKSPYEFSPRLVGEFEKHLDVVLHNQELFKNVSYSVMVRSLIIKNTTKEDSLAISAPELRTQKEREEAAREEALRAILQAELEGHGEFKLQQLHLRRAVPSLPTDASEPESRPTASPSGTPTPSPTPTPVAVPEPPSTRDSYVAQLELRSSTLIEAQKLREVRSVVEKRYLESTGFELELELAVVTNLGSDLHLASEEEELLEQPDTTEREKQAAEQEALQLALTKALQARVNKIQGATLDGTPNLVRLGEKPGKYRLFAVVTSPKPLAAKQVGVWQKELFKSQPKLTSLELRLENRLGQTIRLAPSQN